jgi:hypothetical protein
MPFIKKIEKEMASDPNLNHEYIKFLGLDKFNKVVPRLILGEQSPALLEGRVSSTAIPIHDFIFQYEVYDSVLCILHSIWFPRSL